MKITTKLCALGLMAFPVGAMAELKICNPTAHVQSISVGYKSGDNWTSEGWWNVDPDTCKAIFSGDLASRYYYYRSEVNGGDFDGENYFFCTSPQEYTIVGDNECGTRGYDRESFRVIDTGQSTTYILTLLPN